MKLELFLSDISEIKQEDFNYKRAYTCRKTNKNIHLFGKSLSEILPIAKVCISDYLLSKYGLNNTTGIEEKYELTTEQLDSIIYPFSRVTFTNGSMVDTPKRGAKLDTVIKHIHKITKRKEWLNNEIMFVDISNSGVN